MADQQAPRWQGVDRSRRVDSADAFEIFLDTFFIGVLVRVACAR